tara:strand:+ start:483 stop:875 length:393 start_codon:yes stop_codon:yes gene_type:complete
MERTQKLSLKGAFNSVGQSARLIPGLSSVQVRESPPFFKVETLKQSGAPEKGDLVKYEWYVGGTIDTNFAAQALIIEEIGINVKVMVFGMHRQSKEDPDKYTVDKTDTWTHTVPRVRCKILSTRQGEILT